MEPDREQEYPLCFENHETFFIQSLTDFFVKKAYVNVTLCCKGEEITAHQTILAACSPFFDKLLRGKSERHPYIIFMDVSKEEMMVLLEFMYKGRVNVPKTTLPSLLKIAKHLKIRSFEHEISRVNGDQATSSEMEEITRENSGVSHRPLRVSTSDIVKDAESSMNDTMISTKKKRKEGSEPKSKVINPFARSRRSFEDSDSTFYEEDFVRPGPSKLEVISPPTRSYDSDVEIIDCNPVVVVNESQPAVNYSPEWFRKTQQKDKRKVSLNNTDIEGNLSKKKRNANKTEIENSQEESKGEKEVRVNPLALPNKNSKQKSNSSNLSTVTAVEDTSIGHKLLKKKKYSGSYSAEENSELLKLPFYKLRDYCVLCSRFERDCPTHIKKTHNMPPRIKTVCKKCSKSFYHKQFLKFHKCEPL